MSNFLSSAFVLVPVLLLVTAYSWAFHLRDRPGVVRRALVGLLIAGTLALAVGDAVNGFYRAEGFHARFWGLGFVAMASVHAIVFWLPRKRSLFECLQAALDVVREDFHDAESPVFKRRHSWWYAAGFLAFAAVFYGATFVSFQFNVQFAFFVQEFLDSIRELAARTTLWDFVTARECETTVLYNPFTFLLFNAADRIDRIDFWHLRLLMTAAFVGANLWMHRSQPPGRLFLSHLFFLVVLMEPSHEFNSSAFSETFFALVFFANLLMLLHVRYTVPYFLSLGLVMGIGFVSKELNILNLCLMAFLLATAGLPRRRFCALAGAALLGFAVPTFFFTVSFLQCGVTEGLYHLPFVWFRGAELAGMTQSNVGLLADQGREFPFAALVLRRLTFQTIGEVLYGAASRFGYYALVGVFPLAWMIANLPRRQLRILGVLVLLALPLYGVTFWKGGDSADPLYTMLPFGYIFSGPFLVRLGVRFATIVRRGDFLKPRALYIHGLVAANLLFLGSHLGAAWQVAQDARFIDAVTPQGISFAHEPDDTERAIVRTLRERRAQGRIQDWFFLADCGGSDVHKPLTILAPELTMSTLDIRYSLLPAILDGDHPRIQNAFDVMVRELDYAQSEIEAFLVVACSPTRFSPERTTPSPDDEPPTLLDACARVLHAAPDGNGLVLLEFPKESCRRYIRPELERSRGVRQERPPVIPILGGTEERPRIEED